LEELQAPVDLLYFVPAEPRFEGIDAALTTGKQTDQANTEGDNDQEKQEREMLEQLAQGLKTHKDLPETSIYNSAQL
jgi:hypothetical protein